MRLRWALLLSLAACRTTVLPLVKSSEPRPARVEHHDEGACVVRDFATGVDVPAGAVNLGWVSVPWRNNDEDTFLRLRQAVCAKGGTAVSQAHWNRAPHASVADPPAELEANAWVEP